MAVMDFATLTARVDGYYFDLPKATRSARFPRFEAEDVLVSCIDKKFLKGLRESPVPNRQKNLPACRSRISLKWIQMPKQERTPAADSTNNNPFFGQILKRFRNDPAIGQSGPPAGDCKNHFTPPLVSLVQIVRNPMDGATQIRRHGTVAGYFDIECFSWYPLRCLHGRRSPFAAGNDCRRIQKRHGVARQKTKPSGRLGYDFSIHGEVLEFASYSQKVKKRCFIKRA
jgi:hypothetical protein